MRLRKTFPLPGAKAQFSTPHKKGSASALPFFVHNALAAALETYVAEKVPRQTEGSAQQDHRNNLQLEFLQ
jgi:hypothetical protein